MTRRTDHLPEFLTALYALGFGFFLYSDNGMRVDEIVHYDQVLRLVHGSTVLHPGLTMIPGYHVIIAAVMWLTGGAEFSARAGTFVLSLATVFTFYALARSLDNGSAGTRLLQFTFLPILFPQFFLLYTDVPAMLFVLLMLLAAVKRRYALAGLFGLISCLMRQNDIIWVAFVLSWSYVRDNGWRLIPVGQIVARFWAFFATGLAFVAFVVLNHGQIALGDATAHPLGPLHLDNVCFLLFVAFFLFLPLWWGYRSEIRATLGNRWLYAALLALLPVFWFGFTNSHPYNNGGADFYLRNAILIYSAATPMHKLLFLLPVLLSIVFFTAAPLRERSWLMLYPFTVLALLPEWLVEQRYYLIPLALFVLVRKPVDTKTERVQTALSIVAATMLFVMMERSWRWM